MCLNFFKISTFEESSLPMKYAKNMVFIFLTMKATILDTQSINEVVNLSQKCVAPIFADSPIQ